MLLSKADRLSIVDHAAFEVAGTAHVRVDVPTQRPVPP